MFLMVRPRKQIRSKSKILASLNYTERAEFEDGSAASFAASGSKSLHYTFILEN